MGIGRHALRGPVAEAGSLAQQPTRVGRRLHQGKSRAAHGRSETVSENQNPTLRPAQILVDIYRGGIGVWEGWGLETCGDEGRNMREICVEVGTDVICELPQAAP